MKYLKANTLTAVLVVVLVAVAAWFAVPMLSGSGDEFSGEVVEVEESAESEGSENQMCEGGSCAGDPNAHVKYNAPDAACMKGDCVQGLCSDGRQCETVNGSATDENYGMAANY